MNKPSNGWWKTPAIAATLILSGILQWVPVSAQPYATIRDDADGTEYMAAQILIKFKTAATDAELIDAVKRGTLTLIKHIETDAMKDRGHSGITHMWTGRPVREAIEALRDNPAIEFAEPNWVYTHQAVPTDFYFANGNLWGMCGESLAAGPVNTYGSHADEAWAAGYTGSSGVYVGVVDEGVQYMHPDLDGNIDVADSRNFYDGGAIYTSGQDSHGTHVSGTIGAKANSAGVVGVNWNIQIISAKFLGPAGGTTAAAVQAIDYLTNLKKNNPAINIVALNNSWGGGGYSQSLLDAITRAAKANILFIAAAGNGNSIGQGINNDTSAVYPANYDTTVGTTSESAASFNSVVAVTAIDSAGAKASWANYGATKVHLGAPGVGIYSSLPTDTWGSYSGTSMATPHVTGAAALYASMVPGATAPQIRNALLAATTPTASLAGKTVTGGRLDISRLIPITTAPSAPTIQSISAGNQQLKVTWSPVVGATSYEIYRSTTTGGYGPVPAASLANTSYTDNSVANGTRYYYVVKAVNSYGSSPASNEVFGTPNGPPSAPSGLTAIALSRTDIQLSWTPSPSGSPATGFKIERSRSGGSFTQIATVASSVTSYRSTGLSRKSTYSYRVRAYNSVGNGPYSNTATATTQN